MYIFSIHLHAHGSPTNTFTAVKIVCSLSIHIDLDCAYCALVRITCNLGSTYWFKWWYSCFQEVHPEQYLGQLCSMRLSKTERYDVYSIRISNKVVVQHEVRFVT